MVALIFGRIDRKHQVPGLFIMEKSHDVFLGVTWCREVSKNYRNDLYWRTSFGSCLMLTCTNCNEKDNQSTQFSTYLREIQSWKTTGDHHRDCLSMSIPVIDVRLIEVRTAYNHWHLVRWNYLYLYQKKEVTIATKRRR